MEERYYNFILDLYKEVAKKADEAESGSAEKKAYREIRNKIFDFLDYS